MYRNDSNLQSLEAEREMADEKLNRRLHDQYWSNVNRQIAEDDEYEAWSKQFDDAYFSSVEAGEYPVIENDDPTYQQWIRERDEALISAYERGEIPVLDGMEDVDLPY